MNNALSRRNFLMAATAALIAAAKSPLIAAAKSPAAQVTDPRPPTVDTSGPQEIGAGVWVVPDHRIWLVPNIGIIIGRDAALVVDTGLGPANGERILDLARRLSGRRKLFLTVTHFHPEHGYGAQVFRRDAAIVYNRVQRDELAEKGTRYVDLFRQTQSPAVVAALDGTEIVMPHFVYDGPSTEIDLGGRKVELRHWGLAHTRGDQTVFLPEERILFVGDLIEERMFPIFPWFPPSDTEVDGRRWISILREFEKLDPRVIVPGHGERGPITIARDLASHIETVGREVRMLRLQGKSAEDIIREYKPEIVAAFPGWEHPGLIDWEINYFASQVR